MRKVRLTWMIYMGTALIFCCFLMMGQQAAAVDKTQEKTPGYDPKRTYTAEQLREDFQLLRTALEEAHGGLYFYTSKEEMDRCLDAIKEKLTRP
ncbi:MAG: hypothetical protein L0Y73_03810, partial [Candidatus Aminicenantes bacterium]|nr:hypothetical protein [Candidatus Aminicenantes bacterium]